MSNSGFNSGTGNQGITTGPGNSGTGFGSSGSGSGVGSGGGSGIGSGSGIGGGAGAGTSGGADYSTGTSGFNAQSGTDTGVCPHCGQSTGNRGLEQFLGRLGITEDMIDNLKGQFQNVDIDEYLNTARSFLKDGGAKAGTYAKENPGKVAAGVAALALGAGLIYAAVNRDKS